MSPTAILLSLLCLALIGAFVIWKSYEALRLRPTTGDAGFVGEIGDVRTELVPGREGMVFVHGELWKALSDQPIAAGARVRVVAIKGLKVRVEPA